MFEIILKIAPIGVLIALVVFGTNFVADMFNGLSDGIGRRLFGDSADSSNSHDEDGEKFGKGYFKKIRNLRFKIVDGTLRVGSNAVKGVGNLVKGAGRSLYALGKGAADGIGEMRKGNVGKGLWTMTKGAGKSVFEAGKGVAKAGGNVLGAAGGAIDTGVNAGRAAGTIVNEQFRSDSKNSK